MKKAIAAILCLLLILFLSGCEKHAPWNGKTEELAELLMVEDVSDLRSYVGMVDYVFVGTVEEIVDDVLPNKGKRHEDYFSTYKIRVDKNLKGELASKIEVTKMGGYKKDGTLCLVTAEMPTGVMVPDSGLPELHKTYLFLAYAQPDGSLTLSELFDNRDYSETLLKEYEEAVEKECVYDRERFFSLYDRSLKAVVDLPFPTEGITEIRFKPGPNDWLSVPEEELPVYIDWLRSFRIGEKAEPPLPPGTDHVRIRIEYANGSFFENGMSTVKIGKDDYYLIGDPAPETYMQW